MSQNKKTLMKRTLPFLLALTSFAIALPAAPTPTPSPSPKRNSTKSETMRGPQETLAQSANGWTYVKGEWVHPEGFKFVNGKVLRTTARTGRGFPKPPGKLALDNAEKLTPRTDVAAANAKTAAEKKAAEIRKNLAPRPASQTGSNL